MKRQLILSFAFSVLTANVFAASSAQPVVAEGGSDRLIENRVAEGGSDRLIENRSPTAHREAETAKAHRG